MIDTDRYEWDGDYYWPKGWPDPRGNPFSCQHVDHAPRSLIWESEGLTEIPWIPVRHIPTPWHRRFLCDVWGGIRSIAADFRIWLANG